MKSTFKVFRGLETKQSKIGPAYCYYLSQLSGCYGIVNHLTTVAKNAQNYDS